MLCMFASWGIVWHHASQTARYLFSSNLRWISFIKPSLNLPFSQLYRLLFESWSVSSSIPRQFKSIFCLYHNGGIVKKNVNSRQFFGVSVTPGCVTIIQRALYAKTSKMNCPFTSLGELLFNCPSWIFHLLYYNSRALLRYNDSSKISCTSRDFFL